MKVKKGQGRSKEEKGVKGRTREFGGIQGMSS